MKSTKPIRVKERDSALSEKEIDALANADYSVIRGIEKVASPMALLHDLEFIKSKLMEAQSREN